MATAFEEFVASLPDEKLMALAKPVGADRSRTAIAQQVMDKFGQLGWEKMLERLATTTLQQIGREVSVEMTKHDDRQYLLKSIPKLVSDRTHESLAALSTDLLNTIWEDLGIMHNLDLEILVLELFIGGIESIVGIWTITQLNDVVDVYQIPSRGTFHFARSGPTEARFGLTVSLTLFSSLFPDLRKKDEIVFDIVKSILDHSFVSPTTPQLISAQVPQTPRSPIRPADDRPKRRRAPANRPAPQESKDTLLEMAVDKENAHENDLTSAVAHLKFEPSSSRPRRAARARP